MAKGFGRTYSGGRISGEDEGDTPMAIALDEQNNVVILRFFKPMKWIGWGPDEVEQILLLLAKHLSRMKGVPVQIVIGDKEESVMPELNISTAFSKYITQNWDLLAAAAYAHYLKQGRGLLWVDWLNQLPIKSRLSEVGVLYATPHTKITRALFPNGMSSEARRLIREYDPNVMIVVYWSEGGINRGRTIAMPDETPIQAYERLKGRLNEFEILVQLEEGDR